MDRIWENSPHSGSTLLVLLALADHANDEGVCWPSIPRIAKRARISERQTVRALADLQASGELQVLERGGGKGKSNVYRVTPVSGFERLDTAKDTVTSTSGNGGQTVTSGTRKGDSQGPKGDIGRPKGDIAMSLEPSVKNLHLNTPENRGAASQTLWVQVLGQLQHQFRKPEFETWLRDTQVISQTDGELVVGTANSHALAWLQDHAREPAEAEIEKMAGNPMSVRFVILEKADVPID
jgi:hypothetical protein